MRRKFPVMRGVISLMSSNREIVNFITEIKKNFPDVGKLIDKRMADLGMGAKNYMYTDMMECFSDATTIAIKTKDSETASLHLNYMSKKLIHASEVEREFIDTYYTEPLMWSIKDRKLKSWGWKLFPKNIKELYENTWGEQDL